MSSDLSTVLAPSGKFVVPFPVFAIVSVVVSCAKFAVTVTAEACAPVNVTVVLAEVALAIVAEPTVTVQLTKWYFAAAAAVMAVAV